ncbi:MAG: hypothetical protein KAY22_27625 [Rhizorhabdus sp.]|uniref:hypothetical protein n=1 Tax=Rhizorhabdus sp. TaxID=1968843 RepID=UPI001B7B7722|nr:hypothetical protein [Rhizorhabdus sp.]MBP8236061.1 hypothetical protein [Rhizorhabdus sp.]
MNDSITVEAPSNELVTIEPANALIVFTKDGAIDPLLARIRSQIDAFKQRPITVLSATGRKQIASMAYKVTQTKTHIDGIGKDLVAEQKKIPNKIDATRRRIRETLDEWRDEVREPLTAWETAEEERVNKHKAAMEWLRVRADENGDLDSAELRLTIAAVEARTVDSDWDEYETEAAILKDRALASLRKALTARETREAEHAELLRLRAAEAERLRIEREADIAAEAAAQANKAAAAHAEAAKKAAEDAVRKEREASEARELQLKQQAEQAERKAAEAHANALREIERKAAEEAAAQAAREADKAHRARINKNALDAFMRNGLDEATAKRVITLIAQHGIPNIVISY